MFFSVPELIARLTHTMVFLPGDLILTGTPGRVEGAEGVRLRVGSVITVSGNFGRATESCHRRQPRSGCLSMTSRSESDFAVLMTILGEEPDMVEASQMRRSRATQSNPCSLTRLDRNSNRRMAMKNSIRALLALALASATAGPLAAQGTAEVDMRGVTLNIGQNNGEIEPLVESFRRIRRNTLQDPVLELQQCARQRHGASSWSDRRKLQRAQHGGTAATGFGRTVDCEVRAHQSVGAAGQRLPELT